MQNIYSTAADALFILGLALLLIAIYFFVRDRIWTTVAVLRDPSGTKRAQSALKKLKREQSRKEAETARKKNAISVETSEIEDEKSKANTDDDDYAETTKLSKSSAKTEKTELLADKKERRKKENTVDPDVQSRAHFVIVRRTIHTFDREEDYNYEEK